MASGRRAPYAGVFDPTHRFVTSWILPPAVLFGLRTLLAVYAFTTLFTIFGWNGTHGRSRESQHSFSFFTNLTYWGLAFYYAFSAAHTGSYWLTGVPFLARWPKTLQVAHSMFYTTIVVYPWIVTSKFRSFLTRVTMMHVVPRHNDVGFVGIALPMNQMVMCPPRHAEPTWAANNSLG
jgi:hypothetical protein